MSSSSNGNGACSYSSLPVAATIAAAIGAVSVLAVYAKKGQIAAYKKKQPIIASSSDNQTTTKRRTCKAGRTSHILIQTANAYLSSSFFQALGLVEVSARGPYVLLACPTSTSAIRSRSNGSQKPQPPFILLQEIPPSDNPTYPCGASDIGVSRLCLGVQDVYEMIPILRDKHRLQPLAPPVCQEGREKSHKSSSWMGSWNWWNPPMVAVAYKDAASGTIVELISLHVHAFYPHLNRLSVTVMQSLTSVSFPFWMHAKVNTTHHGRGMAAYWALGFTVVAKTYDFSHHPRREGVGGESHHHIATASDEDDDDPYHHQPCNNKVDYMVSSSLWPPPTAGTVKHVTRIKTPYERSFFCMELLEWETNISASSSIATADNTQQRPPSSSQSIRLAVQVDSVPNALTRILRSSTATVDLWTLAKSPRMVVLPWPLGKAHVASIRDPDGLEVDLIKTYTTSHHHNKTTL